MAKGTTGNGGRDNGDGHALRLVEFAPEQPLDPEKVREIKQSVLGDVACVLARAGGADIEPRKAFTAARNICDILFGHPQRPHAEIPKLFWDTPLGRAVGVCCGDREDGELPLIKTMVHLPHSVNERLRMEAAVQGKSVSEVIAERLTR